MAYNAISGTLIAAKSYIPGNLIVGNVVSGNLLKSNGAQLINVPRVITPTDNALVLNIDGDANRFECKSNLKFDPLNNKLTVLGTITASIAITASYFVGDGSKLTGIATGIGGIFTTVNGSKAYTTSSIQVGASGTPTHTLSVSGSSRFNGAVIYKRSLVSNNYSVAVSDYYVGVNTTSNVVHLILPSAGTTRSGQTFVVKDEGGNAQTRKITISGSGSDTIDGQNIVFLESPYASISLYCNGSNKYFVY
jgi:hypothetical protein